MTATSPASARWCSIHSRALTAAVDRGDNSASLRKWPAKPARAKGGGEGGIRTPDRLAPMPHFECGAFNHSATSPGAKIGLIRPVVGGVIGEECCPDKARNDKSKLVMPGLEPGIHVFVPARKKDVDGRVKPGHDEEGMPGMTRVKEGTPVIEHQRISANGAGFHVARTGKGPPLLLLHGWPEFWLTWEPVMTRLAGRFTLIAPDLRGFGDSSKPDGAYGPDQHASDMLALMGALRVERFG